jgi:hypothetical protein
LPNILRQPFSFTRARQELTGVAGEITFIDRKRAPAMVARGCRKHSAAKGYLKVVILLDDETFGEVVAGATENQCSFAAQARMLIEVGLETLKEWDA